MKIFFDCVFMTVERPSRRKSCSGSNHVANAQATYRRSRFVSQIPNIVHPKIAPTKKKNTKKTTKKNTILRATFFCSDVYSCRDQLCELQMRPLDVEEYMNTLRVSDISGKGLLKAKQSRRCVFNLCTLAAILLLWLSNRGRPMYLTGYRQRTKNLCKQTFTNDKVGGSFC